MSPRAKPAEPAITIGTLTRQEIALIEATRKIPTKADERFHRAQSIITFINAVADGMRSADA